MQFIKSRGNNCDRWKAITKNGVFAGSIVRKDETQVFMVLSNKKAMKPVQNLKAAMELLADEYGEKLEGEND